MLDIVQGIIAIIIIIIIFAMKDSVKKWIAFIGWAIIVIARILGR